MSDNMNVGKCLRTALLYSGKSQAQLARELNLSAAQINIHCNCKTAQAGIIKRYANHFGYSVQEFLALAPGEE